MSPRLPLFSLKTKMNTPLDGITRIGKRPDLSITATFRKYHA